MYFRQKGVNSQKGLVVLKEFKVSKHFGLWECQNRRQQHSRSVHLSLPLLSVHSFLPFKSAWQSETDEEVLNTVVDTVYS